jgi:hypothetical protein
MYRPQLENSGSSPENRRSSERRSKPRQDMTERIRSKAHELWEKKGRVQGKDLEIWLEAERKVKSPK